MFHGPPWCPMAFLALHGLPWPSIVLLGVLWPLWFSPIRNTFQNFSDICLPLFYAIFQSNLRLKICGKYFLLFPQKNLGPEKTDIARCLLFKLQVIKLIKTPILPNGQVVKFLHSKIEKQMLSNLSFHLAGFFYRERK